MQVQFPSSFLWGAALSSYQCEGGNYKCDWYLWEKEKNLQQASSACDHYNLFNQDFQLARKLNLNSLRISIEWSRINPKESVFDEKELEHYLKVINSLLEQGLRPLVTLHHFTNPLWFCSKGGWSNYKNIDYFVTYLDKTVSFLKDKVDLWIIFNEPLVYVYNGFISGIWPPGEKSFNRAKKTLDNIIRAYTIGYSQIKNIYKDSSVMPEVSLAKHMRIFSGCPNFNIALNSLVAYSRSKFFNFWLIDHLREKKVLDFISLNYYCKEYNIFKGLIGSECSHDTHGDRKNSLGWNIDSEGFYKILLSLKRFSLPIIVTENGTSEDKDHLYEDYLKTHLVSLSRAVSEGVDLKGYFWWSLLDNFEWVKGFKERFGLISVDYSTFSRKIKPFANSYAKICRENKLEF